MQVNESTIEEEKEQEGKTSSSLGKRDWDLTRDRKDKNNNYYASVLRLPDVSDLAAWWLSTTESEYPSKEPGNSFAINSIAV